jgi:cyclohexanone monooxygenase
VREWRGDDGVVDQLASASTVVVLGTGASALQFVPKIQPEVQSLTVLQRTPSWVMPKLDWNTSRLERGILRRSKLAARIMRLGMWAPLDLFFALATRYPRGARSMGVIGTWHMGRSIKGPAAAPGPHTDLCPHLQAPRPVE